MYKEQLALHNTVNDELYELIKEVSKFTERDENGNIVKKHPRADMILGYFVMMQEICDTPQLLDMSVSKMAEKYKIKKNASPKLDELEAILKEFIESNTKQDIDGDEFIESYTNKMTNANCPKAVIFTQFERMQRLIVERISKLGGVEIVNGSMSALQKQEHIVNFKFKGDINFMVCTDSANYGVNLQEASLLINFDLPWNPAVWAQRNARIHRLSSTHESVTIINLIARDGLDERILDALYNKQDMAASIVENRESETAQLTSLTHDVMKKLLKRKRKKSDD
jgi:SNF2 family DNA or RNA helicase